MIDTKIYIILKGEKKREKKELKILIFICYLSKK